MQLTARLARIARRLARTQVGAGIVEYALAVGLIAVVAVSAVAVVGDNAAALYDCVGSELSDIDVRRRVNEKITNSVALDAIEKRFADGCLSSPRLVVRLIGRIPDRQDPSRNPPWAHGNCTVDITTRLAGAPHRAGRHCRAGLSPDRRGGQRRPPPVDWGRVRRSWRLIGPPRRGRPPDREVGP